jgi:protein-L-isoaspartate O-methyltransferase
MPLGAPNEVQRLVRIVRREEGGFDREELGAVRFVPLVAGEERR